MPFIHLGPWEHFITELCSESHRNLSKFHIFVGYKFNSNVLHNSQRTCSLMITMTKSRQTLQWYLTMVISIPSLTTNEMILFYMGISALKKWSPVYIWTVHVVCSECWEQHTALTVTTYIYRYKLQLAQKIQRKTSFWWLRQLRYR